MKKLDTINIGQSPNDHSGDAHRTAFDRINQNFQAIGPAIGLLESQAIARPLDEPGTDLNALADTGVYYQNADERAASGKNYPLPRAGLLRVWNTGALRYQVTSATAPAPPWRRISTGASGTRARGPPGRARRSNPTCRPCRPSQPPPFRPRRRAPRWAWPRWMGKA